MFDPEVLQILGLNLLAQKSPNLGESLGNAGLATMQYQRQQEEDKYRKEEREFLKQQREMQMAQLKRDADFSNAARQAFQPPVTPLTAVDDNGNPMPSSGPSFDFSRLYGIDPAKALALQGQMAELNKKERIKLGADEKLFEPGPGGTMRLLASGGDKKPNAIKELEYALEQSGVKAGTPAYQQAMQTFLMKTNGGLDVYRAQLSAIEAGVTLAKARDEGVLGLPGMPPPLPGYRVGGMPGPAVQAPPVQPPPNAVPPGLPPPPTKAPPGLSPKQQRELAYEGAKGEAKRAGAAPTVLDRLAEAEVLLKDESTTGSYLGRGVDYAARAVGKATQGDKNTAALQTISGALLVAMPRMEGPQSDRDVENYKDAAGRVADATVPPAVRLAALKQLREIYQKYAGNQPANSVSGRVINFADLPAGR